MPATRPRQLRLFSLLLMMAMTVAALPSFGNAPVAQAQATLTNTIKLNVFGIDPKVLDGAGNPVETAIADFKYLIVADNVGDNTQARDQGCSRSDPDYPKNCHWTSIQSQNGYAPILTQGDQSDFAGAGLDLSAAAPGNYMISVTADGHKIDGTWFSLPLAAPGELKVLMNKLDLPGATLRAIVFNDNASTNGQPDVPAEQGLAGFRVTVSDTLGEVTNDVFGNPICTQYTNGDTSQPGPQQLTGCLYTDADGMVAVPNLGPNRYTMLATPPDGQTWVQTATLEGNHDWDAWVQEGSTGYDTEFAIAGEPFPWVPFGFVKPNTATISPSATGGITGQVEAVSVYTPGVNGIPYSGSIWGGLAGALLDKPIEYPWIALSDLNDGDRTIWTGKGDVNGNFTIPNVPDGSYQITWWDADQLYLLDWQQVDVKNGDITDVGQLHLTAWYAHLSGRVCTDRNYDGVCQDSEPGLAGFPVAVKRRTNSVIDRGNQGAVTDAAGNYTLDSVYPLTAWVVIEAYSDTYYTTGATYWADNEPAGTRHTIPGAGVDVNFLSIIGQNGHLDWAVQRYNALPIDKTDPQGNPIPHNGGIVGTVSYDTTRNELDPRYVAVENWQVGIPNLDVDLFAPIACTPVSANDPACVANPTGAGFYAVNPADGSLAYDPTQLLSRVTTESWARPQDCTALGADGQPLDVDFYKALPDGTKAGQDCLEAPLVGIQFGSEYAAVDGNYGFGDGCFGPGGYDPIAEACADGSDPTPLDAGDYIVKVNVPTDIQGRPQYQVTREEDINIADGNSYVPQVPPPACVGPKHVVDVAGILPDGPNVVVNPTFIDIGGSPYEGMSKPLCDAKLVTLSNGKSIAPSFTFFTAVPLPGRWYGYIVDDLNLSINPQELFFGEKAGIGNAPIGIYDYANRLVRTISSDPNGVFEVLLPSTTTINCPTPTGVCANLYRIVGNDPGTPGNLNPNYDPQFRTISATFEIFPGDTEPADLAPTQIGVSIQAPGSQTADSAQCMLDTVAPQIFAVSQPYVQGTSRTITIKGQGFGGSAGRLTLGGSALLATSWSENQIVLTVPGGFASGPQQLLITATSGQTSVNGLTIHVLGTGYSPNLITVGPGAGYTVNTKAGGTLQSAIDGAAAGSLIVVYPGGVADATNPSYNPLRAYYENLIIAKPLKIQGVGTGGVYTDANGNAISVGGSTTVDGSIIDGSAFAGDTPLSDAWRTKIAALTWAGNQTIYEGAVITALAPQPNTFGGDGSAATTAALLIDGFKIQGGNQQGFPGNITEIYGLPNGVPPVVETQGGGVFANAYVRNLQLSNNIFQSNGGAYGGAIRLGSPNLPSPVNDNQNDFAKIQHNRIIANGGTNLAGALGIFEGANAYDVSANDICGNFSAEYGGAIGHYGRSSGGKIHDNRIYFNRSYDEAGGIMIAGELPANPTTLSPGAGPVDIYNNLIQANLSNDDGGGLRFLQAGGPSNDAFNVYNNIIVNNIATHEGGGVAIDDAPNVRFYNNTVMKNITTATALTSNGTPAAAGLATGMNSDQMQAVLPSGSPLFSRPLLFNNIFWDNRAGSHLPSQANPSAGPVLTGIGDADAARWDLAVMGGNGGELLEPTNSVLQAVNRLDGLAGSSITPSGTNIIGVDPQVIDGSYSVSILSLPWRVIPGIANTTLVAVERPVNLQGNYRLKSSSPAKDVGAASKAPALAPLFDIDRDVRPAFGGYDIGADEIRGLTADLAISKSDGQDSVAPGGAVHYTVTVTNGGPDAVSLATVSDSIPAALSGLSWACSASAGSSCATTGNGSGTVSLLNGGTATFTLDGTLPTGLNGGSLVNTATVASPAGTADPNLANNSATDTDLIAIPLPGLALLDNFTRSNATTLGSSWSQPNTSIRLSNNQAFGNNAGQAIWNGSPNIFGATQGAAFTFANAPQSTSTALILKASGGINSVPVNFIRVQYLSGGQVTVETTTNAGVSYTPRASFGASFAQNDVISAVAYSDGTVNVYKTSGATTTEVASVVIPTSGPGAWTQGSGGGRIGILLPSGGRVDNFTGGNPVAPPPAVPALAVLDSFDRADANTLGANWSQVTSNGGTNSNIRIRSNKAIANNNQTDKAIWNGAGNVLGATQGAALTFDNATRNNTALILKASGGSAANPASYIRVQYVDSGTDRVEVRTTTNSGGSLSLRGTLNVTFATGDTLTARANANGTVDVWKTTAANVSSYIGQVNVLPSGAFVTGTGRVGIYLPTNVRIDNFRGATLP